MRAAPAHPSDLCGGLLRRAYCAPLNPHAASLAASREKRGELSYVETPAFSLKSIGRARGSSGESGVRRLRPRAFLCGVGGCSPPSAALAFAAGFCDRKTLLLRRAFAAGFCGGLMRRAFAAALNPHAANISATRPSHRSANAGDARDGRAAATPRHARLAQIPRLLAPRAGCVPLRYSRLFGGERCPPPTAAGFLCGVGGYSPPSAALKCCGRRSPTRKGKRHGRKHGGLFSTSRHICPRGRGAASAGGRPYPAPGCPPRPSLCGELLKCPAAGFCGGWRLIRLPPAADICAVRGSCAPSALCLRGC